MPGLAACPCGRGLPYTECCGRWHAAFAADGTLRAPTAEDLMRSRFTAFAALGDADLTDDDGADTASAMVAYLRATWAPEARPAAAELALSLTAPATRFLRLAIRGATGGGPFDASGTVTFTALGRETSGGRVRVTERSRFRREAGEWLYVGGDVSG